jgi:DNA-binding transcriptional ArsR family regulator
MDTTLFKALSDPMRVKLLALVRQAPTGEACFCDLADEFDMPQSSLSHHLKILVNAGLLSRERRAARGASAGCCPSRWTSCPPCSSPAARSAATRKRRRAPTADQAGPDSTSFDPGSYHSGVISAWTDMLPAELLRVLGDLRQLRRAGLVTTEPHGRYTYYRLRPEVVRRLAAALTDLADTAERHVETRRPCP